MPCLEAWHVVCGLNWNLGTRALVCLCISNAPKLPGPCILTSNDVAVLLRWEITDKDKGKSLTIWICQAYWWVWSEVSSGFQILHTWKWLASCRVSVTWQLSGLKELHPELEQWCSLDEQCKNKVNKSNHSSTSRNRMFGSSSWSNFCLIACWVHLP